jgi:hypothetical protein
VGEEQMVEVEVEVEVEVHHQVEVGEDHLHRQVHFVHLSSSSL